MPSAPESELADLPRFTEIRIHGMKMDFPIQNPDLDLQVHVVYAEFVVDLPKGMSEVSIQLSAEPEETPGAKIGPATGVEAGEIDLDLDEASDEEAEVANDAVHGLGEGRTEVNRETYGRRSNGLWNLPFMMFRKPVTFKRITFSYGSDIGYVHELSAADLESPSIDSPPAKLNGWPGKKCCTIL